jgi:hypothetical protein
MVLDLYSLFNKIKSMYSVGISKSVIFP